MVPRWFILTVFDKKIPEYSENQMGKDVQMQKKWPFLSQCFRGVTVTFGIWFINCAYNNIQNHCFYRS